MHFLLSTLQSLKAADPGRFDKSMLDDTQMMHLFFTPRNPKILGTMIKGDPNDACTWEGVYCGAEDRIDKISWMPLWTTVEGTIDFTMMPPLLTAFFALNEPLRGDVDLTQLPDTIKSLEGNSCELTGTLDLRHLPQSMTKVVFKANNIVGLCDIVDLPVAMAEVTIEEWSIKQEEVQIGTMPKNVRISLQYCRIKAVVLQDESGRDRVTL